MRRLLGGGSKTSDVQGLIVVVLVFFRRPICFLLRRPSLRIARLGAAAHLIPASLPLLSPSEGPVAYHADFGWEILLLYAPHSSGGKRTGDGARGDCGG